MQNIFLNKIKRNSRFYPLVFTAFALIGMRQHQKKGNLSQAIVQKPKIAVLGMFHFAGSSGDVAAIRLDNPLGFRRQNEILDVVKVLETYKPTKILVEYPKNLNKQLNQKFQNYLEGRDTLGISETYQLGFRLAKNLKHKSIYGIDYKLDLPMNKIVAYCQRTNKMEEFNKLIDRIKELMVVETRRLKNMTIQEYLAYMNTEEIDKMTNEVYVKDMLRFGDSTSQAGAEVNATWWKRNMIMFKNIMETIENEEERILVIVGSAHRAVIKDFIQDRSDIEYVEIEKLL